VRVPIVRIVAAGLLALALAAPASAASGRVEITLDANFATRVETFTAEGAFCQAGTAFTPGVRFAGRGRAQTFHLHKILTCADGSGTLTILVNASTIAGSPTDQGGWSVVSGTGDWASTRGGGSLLGVYYPDGVIDHYAGRLTS
jgi:hypothetical protein